MKLYDYIACFGFADVISTGLFSGNIVILTVGALSYMFYENLRKIQ